MGTLVSNPAKLAISSNRINPTGLDLNRCDAPLARGHWRAADAAVFRAGQPVMLNSSGEVVVSDGTGFLGVAKWSKMTLGKAVVIDEPVAFTATGQTKTLKHPSLVSTTLVARSTAGGTALGNASNSESGGVGSGGANFTYNLTNGTITSVDQTATVYVSYVWNLTAADYLYTGTNFWGSQDWVTIQDSRITVIEPSGDAMIYTTEFDPSKLYTLTGATTSAGSNVFIDGTLGVFTSTVGSNKRVGTVISIPSAADPFLGIKLNYGSANT